MWGKGSELGGGTKLYFALCNYDLQFPALQLNPFNATFLIILKADSEDERALTSWNLIAG